MLRLFSEVFSPQGGQHRYKYSSTLVWFATTMNQRNPRRLSIDGPLQINRDAGIDSRYAPAEEDTVKCWDAPGDRQQGPSKHRVPVWLETYKHTSLGGFFYEDVALASTKSSFLVREPINSSRCQDLVKDCFVTGDTAAGDRVTGNLADFLVFEFSKDGFGDTITFSFESLEVMRLDYRLM